MPRLLRAVTNAPPTSVSCEDLADLLRLVWDRRAKVERAAELLLLRFGSQVVPRQDDVAQRLGVSPSVVGDLELRLFTLLRHPPVWTQLRRLPGFHPSDRLGQALYPRPLPGDAVHPISAEASEDGRRLQRHRRIYEKTCRWCGLEYASYRRSFFCSAACRQTAWSEERDKRRAERESA